MQYHTSFVLQSIGSFLGTGIEFLGLWALFDRFGNLKGWELPEVALFYGIVNVAFSVSEAFTRGFDVFAGFVKSGDFDRILLRPRSTILQLAGHEVTLKRIGRFTQGAVILVWALVSLEIPITAHKILLIFISISGGTFLFSGLLIFQAGLCFWTTESLEIVNTVTYGGAETMQYPLSIYRRFFRRFFIFIVPLGCVCYFPVVSILGKIDPLGAPPITGWLSPLAGFAFFFLAIGFWRIAMRRYSSTGS